VQEVLAEMMRADFLFTSLGCLKADAAYEQLAPRPHRYLLENLRLTEAGLSREGVAGDLNYSFFDASGATTPAWNIFPALGVEAVRAMVEANKTVVVAVGNYKLKALRAALAGRLFNVLITDERAAQAMLAENEPE
jgi:DNA-binding transcriptional regulator LsrR (DeoR family)